MDQKIPLILHKYLFTHVYVEAIPEHNPQEEKAGTKTTCETNYGIDQTQKDVIVEVTITANLEASTNPPYNFKISVIGFFKPSEEGAENSKSAAQHSAQLLIGAIRQQLAAITATMPWGTFHHGFIVVDADK